MMSVYHIIFYSDDGKKVDDIYISNLECLVREISSRIMDYPRFQEISIIYNGDRYD